MTLGVATLAEEAVRYMMQLELETFDFEAVRSVGLVLSQQNSLTNLVFLRESWPNHR